MASIWEKVAVEEDNLQEIDLIPSNIKGKIEEYLKRSERECEEFKVQHEQLRVNSEQQVFELENQLRGCESRLESESNRAAEFQGKANEYERQCNELSTSLLQIQNTHNNCMNEQLQLSRAVEQLETEKREFVDLLAKRANEIERYSEELQKLSEQVVEANKARCEAVVQAEELASRDLALQYREQRLNQERELLNKQTEWLNKELAERTNELASVRREKSAQTMELQNQVDQFKEELQLNRDMIANFKEQIQQHIEKNESMAQKLKDSRDAHVTMEETFQKQLKAQTRLCDLYKSSAEENQTRVDELVIAMEELQKVYSQTQEEFQKHEESLIEKELAIRTERDELQQRFERQEKELKEANSLLSCFKPKGMSPEKIADLSPSAARASNLLKSGMTLTQIYSEYVNLCDQIQKEKHENDKLNQYLNQILQEIEERAPQLTRQREEYDRTVERNALLTHQLELALGEFEKMKVETDDAKRKSGVFERENDRLKLLSKDLGLQVQTLLKEIEELRGGYVSMSESDSEVTSTSAELITKKLVSFKSIEDLQRQNQKLLVIVRELSEKQELAEKESFETKNAELQQALDSAIAELEELRAARAKQGEILDSIVRQKEMYRVMLSQSGLSPPSAPGQSPGLMNTTVISPAAVVKSADVETAFAQLQDEFNRYRQEKQDNDKVLTEQMDKAREIASELRLQCAKLTAQLEHSNERYKILQTNIEGYKKENTALVDKSQRLAAQVLRHEQINDVLRQDLLAAQEKLARSEVAADTLKAERDLLKSVEARLLQEKEIIHREQKSQGLLVANLQAIQNNLERSESETKMRLTSQIEGLERECNNLKRKVEAENQQYKSAVASWQKELREIRDKYETESEKHHKVRGELLESINNVNSLKQELLQVQAKLNSAELQLSRVGNTTVSLTDSDQTSTSNKTNQDAEVKDLNYNLISLKSENKALKDQLNQAKQHSEQYKAIASSVEQQLKEEIETQNIFKSTMEKRLTENLELHSELEKKIQELEKEKVELANENQLLLSENLSQSSELRKKLAAAQLDLQTALHRAEAAADTEQQARLDCQEQLRLSQEAQDKYERELILHAADVEALSTVKLQLQEAMEKIPVSEELARKSEHTLKEQQKSWEEQIRIFSSERKSLEDRCQELETQNSHLHDQMELLSSQMVALQSRGTPEAVNISLSEDSTKSADQLLEIIRFLRRDKEIALSRAEITSTENIRLKSRLESVEKQVEDLQKNLNESLQKSQVTMSTAAQHAELMNKVEMLNVLTDSNKLLREERETLGQQLRETEAKLNHLEKEISPLQEKNRDLMIQKDSLASESQVLKNELRRWQSRTNQLVEQCHRTSPEELKRAVQEKENLQKQISQLNEETQRLRAENSRLNVLLTSVQNDLASHKANLQGKEKELDKLKEDVRSKENQMADLNRTVQQVKKIGRKYKSQFDELKQQFDEMKTKKDELESAAAAAAAATGSTTTADRSNRQELETKLQETETKTKDLEEQINKLNVELSASKKSEESLKTQAASKEDRSKKVLLSARQKIAELTQQRDNMSKELEEMKKKIGAAELVSEGNLRMSTLKSQFEGRIVRLERELKEMKEANQGLQLEAATMKERMQKENDELMAKYLQNQKQFVQYQAAKVSPTPATPILTGSSSTEPPPTANIKPLASPSSAPPHRPHGVAQTTSGSSSRTTPTASIRPMAIPLARKMAVIPTTSASMTSDSHDDSPAVASSATHSPPTVPQATVAPTPATLPVMVTVTPTTTTDQSTCTVVPVMYADESVAPLPSDRFVETAAIGMPSSSTSPTPSTSDQVVDSSPAITTSATLTTSVSVAVIATTAPTIMVNPHVEVFAVDAISPSDVDQPSDSAVASASRPLTPPSEVTPSSSSAFVATADGETTGKRAREEDEDADKDDEDDWPLQKKTRLLLSPDKPSGSATDQPAEAELSSSTGGGEGGYEAVTSTSTEVTPDKNNETADDANVSQILEIIVVESDDEAENYTKTMEATVTFEREDDEQDDGMDGDYAPETQFEGDERMQEEEAVDVMDEEQLDDVCEEMVEAQPDDDVVEILDDSNNNNDHPMEAQDDGSAQPVLPDQPEEPSEASSSASMQGARIPFLPRIPVRTERLPSIGRQQQLTPFVPIGQGGNFDEGDDSIVPSTPTLFVPRRNDGFAEAVSSPHVPQGRFVFGASQEMVVPNPQVALSQLASQGGMDDTRMDLSQFDESSGRSVPTTPLQVSPPAESGTSEILSEIPSDAVSPSSLVPEMIRGETEVPTVTVAAAEKSSSSNTLDIQEIPVGSSIDSEVSSEPIVEEPDAQVRDEERPVAEEVTSAEGDVRTDQVVSVAERKDSSADQSRHEESLSAPPQHTPTPRRPVPIVWNDSGRESSLQQQQPHPVQMQQHPQHPHHRMMPVARRGRVLAGRGGPMRGAILRGRPMGRLPMRRVRRGRPF